MSGICQVLCYTVEDMKYQHIQTTFFLGLLFATTVLFLWMVGEYLVPVFWAAVLAVVFAPVFQWLCRYSGGHGSFSAVMTIFGIILLVALPVTLITTLVAQESIAVYQNLTQEEGEAVALVERISVVTESLEVFGVTAPAAEEWVRTSVARLADTIAGSMYSFGQVTVKIAIQIAVALYILFFFLRDGRELVSKILHFIPLSAGREDMIITRFTETTRAVVQGTLLIALAEGLIGGITFWLVGVSAPALWGVVMTILSIIPVLGPALVWVPMGLLLIATGSFWAGIIVIVVGIAVISVVDEFVRPIVVGRKAKMPDAVVLLATLGGLASFGISGFVIGPIIAALAITLWVMFETHYREDLLTK